MLPSSECVRRAGVRARLYSKFLLVRMVWQKQVDFIAATIERAKARQDRTAQSRVCEGPCEVTMGARNAEKCVTAELVE